MSTSVGASSNALSYLQSLLQPNLSAGAAAVDPLTALLQDDSGPSSDPLLASMASGSGAPVFGSTPSPTGGLDPGTLAVLISLQGQGSSNSGANTSAAGAAGTWGGQGPSSLFGKLDANGDGQVSKWEFEQALGGVGVDQSSADVLYSRLDKNGDGSLTPDEMPKAHGHRGHHHASGGGVQGPGGQAQDPISQLMSGTDATGATSQSVSNSDGSTTTTTTYADGTKVEMTTPAASSNASGGNGVQLDSSLIQQWMKLQTSLLPSTAGTVAAFA